jgi:formyl-CoA transferase
MQLSGIRVVEAGQVLSAPYAGMILGDLGAEVIKVEKPVTGDDARNMGSAFRDGASMTFHEVNRGKRSVVIDLKAADGPQPLFRLLETADVFIHNLRPGEAVKLGVDAASVTRRFPRLVYCEMSAFGHKGPRRMEPGYEPLLQAFGGLISINGDSGGPPSRMGASLVDQRAITGAGCVVTTSLLETAIGWGSSRVHEYLNQGRSPERHGTGHPNLVPYQAFDTADGQIMVCAGNDRLFAKLATAMGQPQWMADNRFATNRQRLKHRALLVDLIQQLLVQGERGTWIERLASAGVPVAAVNTIPEMVAESQVEALDIIRPVGAEGFVLAGLPLSFNGERPAVRRSAPRLGADTQRLVGNPHATQPEN